MPTPICPAHGGFGRLRRTTFHSSQAMLRRSSFHDAFVTGTGGGVKVAVNHLVPWSG
jgi:hypothetical protein